MENHYYYKKYIKYKNRYLDLKKKNSLINLEQKGGYNSHTNPESLAGKLLEVIQIMRGTFTPNNSSMFQSTFYFNDQRCLELSIQKIYELKQEAYKYFRNDPSYSAKMSMLSYAINTIEIFLNCAKTKFSEQQILYFVNYESKKYFRNITDIPANNLEFILALFHKNGIDPHNFICSNTINNVNLPGSSSTPVLSGTRGHGGCTDPNAINYNRYATYNDGSCKYPVNKNSDDGRCVYQDPKCLGDKDVITLDDIDKSNINNVVRVDKKCYDADELQKWLVNNSSLPHNRQKYTSKDLNKCVKGSTIIPNPSSPLNPTIPPISNLNTDPYALNDSYAPIAPYSSPSNYGPLSSTIIQTPLITASPPIVVNSENDDDSELLDDYDEPSSDENTEELQFDESITKIEIQPIKGKKITYTKNGTFELKEGKKKNKDIQFKLELYINNKKSYFIQTETKKKSYVNLFYNEDEKSKNGSYKVKEIKSITIEDSDRKVKINYNTKPIKKLIDKIKEIIISVTNDSN